MSLPDRTPTAGVDAALDAATRTQLLLLLVVAALAAWSVVAGAGADPLIGAQIAALAAFACVVVLSRCCSIAARTRRGAMRMLLVVGAVATVLPGVAWGLVSADAVLGGLPGLGRSTSMPGARVDELAVAALGLAVPLAAVVALARGSATRSDRVPAPRPPSA